MSTEQIVAEGRTLKESIEKACQTLGVTQQQMEYKLDAEHFRTGADTVKIFAWKKNVEVVEIGDRTRQLISGILTRIGIQGSVEVELGEEVVRAIVVTEEPALLIGRGGQTIDALQHLVNKALVRTRTERRIQIDLENYREKRDINLRQVAARLCDKVTTENCVITLKPLNAYDRRLVHMEVAQFPQLASRSVGDGQNKKVQIYPATLTAKMQESTPQS